MDLLSKFQEHLAQLGAECRKQGLSVQDVVTKSGQSRTTVWRIFSGNDGVALSAVLAVMKALNMPEPDAEMKDFIRAKELPLHPYTLEMPVVAEALDRAVSAALSELDVLFAGLPPESQGLSSNFAGVLHAHLSAMLTGEPSSTRVSRKGLNRLVYTPADIGAIAGVVSIPEAAGWAIRLNNTDQVMYNDTFIDVARFPNSEAFINREAAVDYFMTKYLPVEGHPPGPVSVVPLYYLDDVTVEVGFEPPAQPTA